MMLLERSLRSPPARSLVFGLWGLASSQQQLQLQQHRGAELRSLSRSAGAGGGRRREGDGGSNHESVDEMNAEMEEVFGNKSYDEEVSRHGWTSSVNRRHER